MELSESLRLDRPTSTRPLVLGGLALLAAAVACVYGLAAGLTGSPDATNRLRDDAFYEFAWAANVAQGRGPTVSDGATTSGVQLLWSLLLVPFAWAFGAPALPTLAPWLGLGLHAATAGLWWRSCRDRIAGCCVAACWLGHPLLVRECQNGQETALACLLATCLWCYRSASERTFLVVSLLAVLARSDLLAVVAVLSAWRHRRCWYRAFVVPVAALALHVACNLALGGGVWPDSALPMAWLWHANHRLADPDGVTFWSQAWWFFRPVLLGGPWALASAMGIGFCVFLVVRPWWPATLRAVPALAVGCASALGARDLATPGWAALFLALLPAARARAVPWPLLCLLCGFGAIVLLHWGLRWYPRDYYVAPLVVAAIAAIARHGRCRLLLIAFAVAQVADHRRVQPEPLSGQVEMQMAGTLLAEVLPPGERVGCFNAGLVAFHAAAAAAPATRRAVVNLDGVVDARAFAALQRGQLAAWLDGEGIRFVLDNPVQFLRDPRLPHAAGPWFGPDFDPARDLVEVARFDAPGIDNGRPGGDSMRLYWRRGRGAAPALAASPRDLGRGRDGARYALWPARPGGTLVFETEGGVRQTLATVDAETAVIVRLAPDPNGAARLFVAGQDERVLQLPPL